MLSHRKKSRLLAVSAFATFTFTILCIFRSRDIGHGLLEDFTRLSPPTPQEDEHTRLPSLLSPSTTQLEEHDSRPSPLPTHSASQMDEYTPLPSHVAALFTPLDAKRKDYHEWNSHTLLELHSCIALQNCGRNQQKFAILASEWIVGGAVKGWRGGEGVWGASVHKNLQILGYTVLFAESFKEAMELYRLFPDLVKVVLRNAASDCHSDPECVKGPSNPRGIPAWKIFDFEFFPSRGEHYHASLMKGKWILSANPDRFLSEEESPFQYIGYSLEEECQRVTLIPLSSRSNQVWILMKQIKYVYDHRFAWNRSFFPMAAKDLNMNFVGAWLLDQHYLGWDPEKDGELKDFEDRERGIINYGRQNATQFTNHVGMSKVMIGVGNPYWSPSPYHALCQGVPFINPIIEWDLENPLDRTRWTTQQPSLEQFDPPYVYHVHARNYGNFIEAIKAASTTEIPSFIPEHMTEVAVQKRLKKLMETDWRSLAVALLEERLQEKKAGKETYMFEL